MKHLQRNNTSVVDVFDATVAKHPNKIALIMVNGKEWTFYEVTKRGI